MKKKNGLIVSLIAVIFLLSIVSIVSIIYNFLGGFYYCRVLKYSHILGENLTINVQDEGSYVIACNFSGSLVIDGNIKQNVNAQMENTQPLYLRAKFGINDITLNGAYMFGQVNWVQATDGYIYFNQVANANQNIAICSEIKVTAQMELRSSVDYIMYFIVESSINEYEFTAL